MEMAGISVAIGSDHAGYEQKKQLVNWLLAKMVDVHDVGPYSNGRVDYPDYAALVASEVSSEVADYGILVCGTGIGMAIVANKFSGVRAASVMSPELARLAREHNDANVLALSGRFVDLEANKAIVEAFFSTGFGGGRHAGRVAKIAAIEQSLKDSKPSR